MRSTFLTVLMFMFSITALFGQKAENKKYEVPIKNVDKNIESTQAVEGNVIFTDGTNQLLLITDEGNFGAIELKDGIPSATTNKLYNNGGTLTFNGTSLGSGGASAINDLSDGKTDDFSLFLGNSAGSNDDGGLSDGIANLNTGIGYGVLTINATGIHNTAIGTNALHNNENSENTAVGASSLYLNSTGQSNTAVGAFSLYNNTTGKYNIAIGRSALGNNVSGYYNTAIGYLAGNSSIGSKNIFIGYYAGSNETTSDKLYIESSPSTSPLIWGDFNTDSLKFNGNVHISGNLTFDGNLLNNSLNINGTAHVSNSFSVGNGAQSLVPNSVAFGENSAVLGPASITTGINNTATAYNSSTFGLDIHASSYLSTVIGRFNDDNLLYTLDSWVATEPLFVIGNGSDDANRSNAFTVLKNGNTFIEGNLDINGKAAIGTTASATGNNSFAIGSNINASGNGTIFLSDNSATSVQNASNDNRFAARFTNGYRFYTTSDLSVGVKMNAGDNAWSSISDSTKKENFLNVNIDEILGKISRFNLRSWNYKGQDPQKHRHYGPMAQEFFNAFGNDGIGAIGNDTTIASADFDGINLIAIQALEKRTSQQKNSIHSLEDRIKELEEQNNELVKMNLEYRNQNAEFININKELMIEFTKIKEAISKISTPQNNIKLASKK